MNVFK